MAEQLTNIFNVNLPIEQAWPIICDLERIAPCMPGAQLDEIEGDIFRGRVKIKLGAIVAQFKGQATFIERNDTEHTARLVAKGRDTGGRGNAEAEIHAAAEALSPTSTRCTVTTDLNITGKVAQFGRGVMSDISKKLMEQFANNLNTMLDQQGPNQPKPDTSQPDHQTRSDEGETTSWNTPSGEPINPTHRSGEPITTTRAADGTPTVRKIEGPAAEPIDVAGVAGQAVLKRLTPALVALLVAILFVRRSRHS